MWKVIFKGDDYRIEEIEDNLMIVIDKGMVPKRAVYERDWYVPIEYWVEYAHDVAKDALEYFKRDDEKKDN